MNKIIIASIFFAALPTHAAEPVSIVGLGVGGAMKNPPRCPFNTDLSKVVCWIDSPFIYSKTGSRSGTVHLPNPDSRPKWAAYASFNIELSKSNLLNMLEIKTFGTNYKDDIVSALSGKFGPATSASQFSRTGYSAVWTTTGVHAELLCSEPEFCLVKFRSAAAQSEYEAEMAKRRAVDAARPKL